MEKQIQAQAQVQAQAQAQVLNNTGENTELFAQEFRQHANTKIVPSRKQLQPGTFKTEPCK